MAIVNHDTIAINAYHFNTMDDSKFDGHFYSNKAPGQSLVGVPVYLAFKLATALPPIRAAVNGLEKNSAWNMALQDAAGRFVPPKLDFALLQYLESIVTAAIPSVLFLLLFFWFLGYFSSSLLNKAVLTLALGLGTIVFPYSQLFYSHVPGAGLDFAGFALVFIAANPNLPERRGSQWLREHTAATVTLAGLALGLAVVFEYPAALISAAIGIYAVLRLPRRTVPYLIAGCLPAIAIVMAYDYAAYHNPFTTGYGKYEVLWKQEGRGIAGFTLPPSGSAIDGMTVSRFRGLFFLSPFLLLAFPGYVLGFLHYRAHRASMALLLAIPVAFFFAIACYWGWNGGQVVGPRYLIPMLPFLTLPIIFVLDRLGSMFSRVGVYALILLSAFNVWAETIGGRAFPRGFVQDPLFGSSLPRLFGGQVPMSLGSFFGLRGPGSLVPLALIAATWSALLLLPLLSKQEQPAIGLFLPTRTEFER